MFNLFNFPSSIVITLLSEWLDLLELSKLDVSYCNKLLRNDWLYYISNNNIFINNNTINDSTNNNIKYLNDSYLQWLYKYCSLLTKLIIPYNITNHNIIELLLQKFSSTITTIIITQYSIYIIPLITNNKEICARLDTLIIGSNSNIVSSKGLHKISDYAFNLIISNCNNLKKLTINCSSAISNYGMKSLANNSSDIDGTANDNNNSNGSTNSITDLDLSTSCRISDIGVQYLANNKLTRLILSANMGLSAYSPITDKGINTIIMSKNYSNLITINLSNRYYVTDNSINAISYHCNQLKEINFNNCSRITSNSLINLINNNNNLIIIEISNNDNVTNEVLHYISNNCLLLQLLNIKHCRYVTISSIISIISNCRDMRALMACMGPCMSAYDLIKTIITCDNNLEKIELVMNNNNTIVANTNNHYYLTNNNSNNNNSNNNNSNNNSNCSNMLLLCAVCSDLSSICYDYGFTDSDMQALLIRQSNKLTTIDFRNSFSLTGGLPYYNNNKLQLPLLVHLNLYNCRQFTDKGLLLFLQASPFLLTINIAKCAFLTDTSVMTISEQCPDLSVLDISHNSNITDNSITAIIKNCRKLIKLQMAYTNITDMALLAVAEYSYSRLQELSVSNCMRITESGVNRVCNSCDLLTNLLISGSNVETAAVTRKDLRVW